MAAIVAVAAGADWLQFRGTDNTGTSLEKNLPVRFGPAENVTWRVPLVGRGPSSPIVVAGRVFVTCSSGPKQDRLHVLSFDAASGKRLWERQLWATGHTLCNPFAAVATCTPASDGRLLWAFYSSNDLACFDLDGNLQWFRGLAYERPNARNDAGMGSSPLVVGDVVVVQVESQGDAFVMGIDKATGQTLWCMEREREGLWSSPIVLRAPEGKQDLVLLQSRVDFEAIDPRTGQKVASYDHWCDTIASATTAGDRIFLPAGGLRAIAFDWTAHSMRGLWESERMRGDASSPVAYQGRVYVLKPPGILVCGDAATGELLWQLRLKGPFWASPVVADGHLYAVNHEGLVQVVRLGEKGELVGTGQLENGILASPAVAGGALYFRSDAALWKIALP